MVFFTDFQFLEKGMSLCLKEIGRSAEKIAVYILDEKTDSDTAFQIFNKYGQKIKKISRFGKNPHDAAEEICMLIEGQKMRTDEQVQFLFGNELDKQIINMLVDEFHDTSFCSKKSFPKEDKTKKKTVRKTSAKKKEVKKEIPEEIKEETKEEIPEDEKEQLVLELKSGNCTKEALFDKYKWLNNSVYSSITNEMENHGETPMVRHEDYISDVSQCKETSKSIWDGIEINLKDAYETSEGVRYLYSQEVNQWIRSILSTYCFDMADEDILKIEKVFQCYEVEQRDPFEPLLSEENKQLEAPYFREVLKKNGITLPDQPFMELFDLYWYYIERDLADGEADWDYFLT